MKRILNGEKDKKANKLDVSEGIEYKPLCPEDIGKITSCSSAHSRSFHPYHLINRQMKNLHIRCYMDYYGGYAEHGRQVVYGLHETGRYRVKVTNIKTPVDVDPIMWQKNNWFIHNTIDTDDSNFMVIAGPGWLQKKFLPNNGRCVVGWTMTESMDFSSECAEWLNNADYLLCPTDADVGRAKRAGVENIFKVHLGYDAKLFHPYVQPINFVGLKNYVFGVLGSWNVRKGVEDIIRAYCKAFSSSDDVTLLLCCKYGNRKWGDEKDNDERWTIQYEFNRIMESIDKDDLPHIALVDIPVHETVLPSIMANFDCLVGFSSGESTWLPGLQAMRMKIPVIQLENTCCGYMEYMNDDNALLCKDVKYRTCSEEFWRTTSEYYEGQTFGFGNYDELADNMCRVTKDIKCNEQRVDDAFRSVEKWTWEDTVKQLEEFLVKIY